MEMTDGSRTFHLLRHEKHPEHFLAQARAMLPLPVHDTREPGAKHVLSKPDVSAKRVGQGELAYRRGEEGIKFRYFCLYFSNTRRGLFSSNSCGGVSRRAAR